MKKIKPTTGYAGVSREGRIMANTCRADREFAAFLAGFAKVIPVVVVPLADYRALVKKARWR